VSETVQPGASEVLFICTGNYYRSRFAEAAFNHRARGANSRWRAFSRGLAIHLIEGDLSPLAAEAMAERGIPPDCTGETRMPLTEADLRRARLVIALKEGEHRPLLERDFGEWADRVRYWHVDDLDRCEAETALARIEAAVGELLAELDDGAG
jgi:protein-tyrosine phosphatase